MKFEVCLEAKRFLVILILRKVRHVENKLYIFEQTKAKHGLS